MTKYIGIFSNSGKYLSGRQNAFLYACQYCGIAPLNNWENVNEEFRQMFLEWFFSGDWITESSESPDCSND